MIKEHIFLQSDVLSHLEIISQKKIYVSYNLRKKYTKDGKEEYSHEISKNV